MNIDEIIRKWYALASGEDVDRGDAFFRFLAVWVAFNALYASRQSVSGDRNQVRSFSSDPEALNTHLKSLESDPEYRKAILIVKSQGVRDDDTGRHYSIADEKDLEPILECVYQVRCNLFHGRKVPDDLRDEQLVNAGYIIISRLVEPYA